MVFGVAFVEMFAVAKVPIYRRGKIASFKTSYSGAGAPGGPWELGPAG